MKELSKEQKDVIMRILSSYDDGQFHSLIIDGPFIYSTVELFDYDYSEVFWGSMDLIKECDKLTAKKKGLQEDIKKLLETKKKVEEAIFLLKSFK